MSGDRVTLPSIHHCDIAKQPRPLPRGKRAAARGGEIFSRVSIPKPRPQSLST
jgi:hypothetical protein